MPCLYYCCCCCCYYYYITTCREMEDVVDKSDISCQTAAAAEVDQNVWLDISNSLQTWTHRLLDTESRVVSKSNDFLQVISDCLYRQQLDGLLTELEVNELKYIGQLWVNLSHAVSSYYTFGRTVVFKERVICVLLELYSMKQIPRQMVTDICMNL